ncbi:MAG: hypothetical protein GY845_01675 [Planctomycetes bacterium]|nr:hypothetical protein [Planctomycetota bacterium]
MGVDLYLKHNCNACGREINLDLGRAGKFVEDFQWENLPATTEEIRAEIAKKVAYAPKSWEEVAELCDSIDDLVDDLLVIGRSEVAMDLVEDYKFRVKKE